MVELFRSYSYRSGRGGLCKCLHSPTTGGPNRPSKRRAQTTLEHVPISGPIRQLTTPMILPLDQSSGIPLSPHGRIYPINESSL